MGLRVEFAGSAGMMSRLDQLPTSVMDAVYREMTISGKLIESGAKGRARVNTGKFRSSIHSGGDRKTLTVTVGTNDVRAEWFEYGTGVYGPRGRPIVIKATNAKFLHWISNGQHHFARQVEVRGIPAQPFLHPAYEEERPVLLDNINKAIAKELS